MLETNVIINNNYAVQNDEKKRKYCERVLQVEKASFVPLVFTTAGGMAPECNTHHKRVAQLISEKRKETYSSVINCMRTKLRFALLKSILMAIRGVRGKRNFNYVKPLSGVSFGLIPEDPFYEVP